MLNKYVEQILSIYNYVDSLMLANRQGIIEYFIIYRPDISTLNAEETVGKHVLDTYPTLTGETSSIMRALNQGVPTFNEYQHLITYKGDSVHVVNTTLPIVSKGQVIGAVDISRYVEPHAPRSEIVISMKPEPLPQLKNDLFRLDDIVTQDSEMLNLKEKILKISQTNSSVLIYGSTGTGKELVAQSIHSHSNRGQKHFVSQNCAAIPAALLESILFGTVRGSYTGAENRKGLFEEANGGTLFLDEISSMEIGIQAKILKAIEEKRIRRLGSNKSIDIDVRIISAINEPPHNAIKEGRLREDLFYRLGVLQINVPNLTDRQCDIPLLTDHFIMKFNKQMNRRIEGAGDNVKEILQHYSWPGNVRELKNVIESAFNLATADHIQEKDLPEYLLFNIEQEKNIENLLGKMTLNEMLNDFEKKILLAARAKTKNNAQAAELLGISKQRMKYKSDKHEL